MQAIDFYPALHTVGDIMASIAYKGRASTLLQRTSANFSVDGKFLNLLKRPTVG